jgi:YVTN family beta-propeller protein
MKQLSFKILMAILLITAETKSQIPYHGVYNVTGYWCNSSFGHPILLTKELDSVAPQTFHGEMGDVTGYGANQFEFQFTVNPGNTVGSFVHSPIPSSADFMTIDFHFCDPVYFNSTIYNNTYDPATKTFWLHYGYSTRTGLDQTQFDREIFEKWEMYFPYIKTFTPLHSCDTATVTISGYGFNGATDVSIGGVNVSYTVNSDSSLVAIVPAGVSGKITIATPLGSRTNPVIYSSDHTDSYLYITDLNNFLPYEEMVSIINTTADTVSSTIEVPVYRPDLSSPPSYGVCVSPDGSTVYVTADSTLKVINTTDNTFNTVILGGYLPGGVCISPDGSKVYAVNNISGRVYVINTFDNTVLTTIYVGNSPDGICISPDGNKLYVASFGASLFGSIDSTVTVINTATNLKEDTIIVGKEPEGMCISPDGSKLYVANYGSNNVSVINTVTNAVIDSISVGSRPAGICISSDGSTVYVTNYVGSTVSVINTVTNTVINTIPLAVDSRPWGINVTPDGSSVYVAIYNRASISKINTSTNTVIGNIGVGIYPCAFGNFILTLHCGSIRWEGSVSTAWENPANWNTNTLPGAGADVYIDPGKPRYPVIHSMASCRSLHQADGTTVTVDTGYKLKILGP